MKLRFFAAAGLTIAIASQAQSQNPADVQDAPTAGVVYADLNLASPAGIAHLNSRVRNAVDAISERWTHTIST